MPELMLRMPQQIRMPERKPMIRKPELMLRMPERMLMLRRPVPML
jgi:hypothetical protein